MSRSTFLGGGEGSTYNNTLHIVHIRQHHSTWQTETKQMIMIQRPMQHPVAGRHIRPAGVHL